MSDVIEQQIVLLGPKERHRIEALPRPEHIAGSRLALPFGDNPVLDADRLAGQQKLAPMTTTRRAAGAAAINALLSARVRK